MKEKLSKLPTSTIIMYIIAIIVGLTAIALLVNNIIIFNKLVNNYISQGYVKSDVISQLIPNQLLPNVFENVIYIGVACTLWAAGLINTKVSFKNQE